MLKTNPLNATRHNFIFQGNDIFVFADGSPVTSFEMSKLWQSCGTIDYFSETEYNYTALLLTPAVEAKSVAIALGCATGVMRQVVKMPLRTYFAISTSLLDSYSPDFDGVMLDLPPLCDSKTPSTLTATQTARRKALYAKKHTIKPLVTSQAFAHLDNQNVALASRAHGLLLWRSGMKYCPKCGAKLSEDGQQSALKCTKCSTIHFPRVEPCVIVTLMRERDDGEQEILLARHTYRNQDVFTCIAGFIEVGETCENAVAREVREEVGLSVKNIRYIKSQAWPFPDQLMLAFSCDFDGGEVVLQKDEIAEAEWFSKSNLPPIPKIGSVAHSLIHLAMGE